MGEIQHREGNGISIKIYPCRGILALLCALILSQAARAAVTVQAESKSFSASASQINSSFDVYFSSVSGSPVTLSGYQVKITLTPTGAGLSFTTPLKTSSPHLPQFASGDNFDTSGSGVSIAFVTDFSNSSANDQPLVVGNGLMRVPFSIPANTVGVYSLHIDTSAVGTQLADNNGNAVAFTPIDGTIQVSAVPEPSSIVLAMIAAIGFAGFMRRRGASHSPAV